MAGEIDRRGGAEWTVAMAEQATPLAGKVALITGASRGIGRDVAVALAQAGADIVIASRSETVTDPRMPGTIFTVAAEVEARGRRALPVKLDVTKDDEIESAVERRRCSTFGRLDVLINNAAIQVPGNTATVQPRHIDLIYRVDLRAPIMCIRAALEPMEAGRRPDTLSISPSRAAVFPGPGPYGRGTGRTFEAAVLWHGQGRPGALLTQSLAKMDLQSDKIAVNVLSPEGRIRTPGNTFFENSRENPDLNFEQAVDMAKATVWICGQDPQSYTGNILFDRDVGAAERTMSPAYRREVDHARDSGRDSCARPDRFPAGAVFDLDARRSRRRRHQDRGSGFA